VHLPLFTVHLPLFTCALLYVDSMRAPFRSFLLCGCTPPRYLWVRCACGAHCRDDEDGETAGMGEDLDSFDTDSEMDTPKPRGRKRSSMVERESFSELPGLPEELSASPWPATHSIDSSYR
jgi:hypothetical protein